MRTIIYARFSSTLQNSRSADDQVALCRARCVQEGWEVVGVHKDEAISGAAGIGEDARPGLFAAIAAIEAGGVDQLLTESTDRIARHQGDAFAVRERIEYAGARLFTLLDGVVDDITGTIKGLFDARFRKDLGARTRRGQAAVVASGRIPAGLAYGYLKAPRLDGRGDLVRGERTIDSDQAEVVVRIFSEYAAGSSPRAIAEGLNRDGIPAPRGGSWRASTIAGDRRRRNGMLQNRLYVGEIVHARTSKVPEPRTRKTRIRPNAEADWIVQPAPELAIVGRDLWERVQVLRSRHAQPDRPERARRPKHLLSGLAVCGVCGGGYTIASRDRWGCGRWRDGRGCSNNRTVAGRLLEERVLAGLGDKMLNPDVVAAYVREFHREHARRSAEVGRRRAKLDRALAAIDAKIARLVEAFGERGGDIEEVRAVLAAARVDREGIKSRRRDLDALSVLTLHPGIADDYRRRMARIGSTIGPDDAPFVRSLIDRVTITPAPEGKRGVSIELSGRLAGILALATGAPPPAEMYYNGGAGSGNRTRVTSLEG
ncbi:MAG TPA: recombinase family protein [Allosphingosinicella sp.]|nr:recombinase family protein [Allosphingosinicella sp.]